MSLHTSEVRALRNVTHLFIEASATLAEAVAAFPPSDQPSSGPLFLDTKRAVSETIGDLHVHIGMIDRFLEAHAPSPSLSECPKCGGPADNGHTRCDPPSPYYCTKCEDDQ